MLKGVFVEVNIVIVIVWVSKEVIFNCKYKRSRNIGFRQEKSFGFAYREHIFDCVAQVFTVLVAQVGVSVAVADDLERPLYPDGAVVGGDNELAFFLCNHLQGII